MLHFGNTLVNIWNFISNHWRLILEGGLVVILFILQLVKKRPVKVVDSIVQDLFNAVSSAVVSAESIIGSGHGAQKKEYVLQAIRYHFDIYYPNIPFAQYEKFVSDLIEVVLSTPQKKGVN